jgi:hypothetical protein
VPLFARDRPVILSDGRSHGPYQPSDAGSPQAQSESGAAAIILMPGPRRRSTNRPLHSALSLRPTYDVPALRFDTGHRAQAQLQAQDDWQHSQQQALPPVGEQQPPQQQEPRQQRRPAAEAGPTQPHNFTGDSAWSYGGAHTTASDALLLPHPRDAEVEAPLSGATSIAKRRVLHFCCTLGPRSIRSCMPLQVDALEAELADMRNAVSSPTAGGAPDPIGNVDSFRPSGKATGARRRSNLHPCCRAAASTRVASPPSGQPPTALLARQHSLPISLKPASVPVTLVRSATVKPGSTLSRTGPLTMTLRRQRNQATAERARVRLQCLHQVTGNVQWRLMSLLCSYIQCKIAASR